MKKLPLEVLNDIFLLLHHKEKVECMLVCRHWAYVISTCSLLNTLHLSQMKSFEKLISTLQEEPYRETQVERLILNLRLGEKFDPSLIPTLFPNLRVIYLIRSDHRQFQRRRTIEQQQQQEKCQWIPMEYIAEIVSHTLTCEILASNLCSRLKILSVQANDYGTSARTLISLLVNAPSLSTLSMRAFGISFQDLELLHATLPLLSSVKLTRTRIMHEFMPTNVQPATSVTIFTLGTYCDIIQMKTEWVRYIKRKYTQLVEWQLICPNTRSDQTDDAMSAFRKEGILPLVQSFGSRLNTISVNIRNYGSNFFKALDDTNCRIENLSFSMDLGETALDDFIHSKQVHTICTLAIDETDVKVFGWLKGLTKLKSLTLVYKYSFNVHHEAIMDTITLNDLLDMCSHTLESITVKKVRFSIDVEREQREYQNIKTVSLYDVLMPSGTDAFVSHSFPHLRGLSLIFCGMYGTVFHLPKHHLAYLEVAERFYFNISHVLVITDRRRQWYSADRTLREHTVFKNHSSIHDASLYPATSQINAWNDMVDITFVCASVQRLFVLAY